MPLVSHSRGGADGRGSREALAVCRGILCDVPQDDELLLCEQAQGCAVVGR